MIKHMLPDYFEGVKKHNKNDTLNSVSLFMKLAENTKIYDVLKGNAVGVAQLETPELAEFFRIPGHSTLLLTYMPYLKGDRKNYVFSPYLASVLSGTACDVACSSFPSDFSGYIELPGIKDEYGDELFGVFVNIKDIGEKRIFRAAGIVKTDLTTHGGDKRAAAVVYVTLDLHDGVTFHEAAPFKTFKTTATVLLKGKQSSSVGPGNTVATTHDHLDPMWLTVANAIIYITNCTSDDIERLNEFSEKASKRAYEEEHFTKKPHFYLDLKTKITYNVDSTFVKGHFFWQWRGKGRTQYKLTYRKPHKRSYKKKGE